MKQAVVVQHVGFEDLGTLAPLLDAYHYVTTTYRPPEDEVWAIDPSHVDLLVILGGPMSANDDSHLSYIADEIALARSVIERNIPFLGICLGAQIMAKAAGGSVAAMPRKEIEMSPVRLTEAGRRSALRHLPLGQSVLHWHGEAIVLPVGATRLAETDKCEVQAFSLSPKTLGVQFHLETDLRRIQEWTSGHAAELAQAGLDAGILHSAALENARSMELVSHAVMREWLEALGHG